MDQMLWAYRSYLACIVYFSPSSQEPFALLLKIKALGRDEREVTGAAMDPGRVNTAVPQCVFHRLFEYL